jgi:hypothetical protein
VAALDPSEHDWLAIVDDDVTFTRGSLHDLVAVSELVGFDLAQPAHSRASYQNFAHTCRRRFRLARSCSWVEIGPVVVFDAAARRLVLPFPETGMGWGVELEWADHDGHGLHLGIVDAVPVTHLVPAGSAYDRVVEEARAQARQAARGLDDADVSELMRTKRSWRPWSALRAPAGLG